MNRYEKIRESIVAGSFYSNDPYVLRLQIEDFLKNAKNHNLKDIKAIICPHAGYIYSGQVAAFSYKQIEDKKYDSIIIISPSHSEYFDFISVYDGDAYNTPFGKINIDKERSRLLADYDKNIKFSEHGHYNEHSVEVQLPFLQYIYKDFRFIPVVIGAQNKKNIECIGKAVGDIFANQNILIIASTDLSHYHQYGEALALDKEVEKLVSEFDIDNLENEFLKNNIEMCGGGPVIAAMMAAKKMGANKAVILKYQNSGDVSGEKQAVVGYLSAAVFTEKTSRLSDNPGEKSRNENESENTADENDLTSMELNDSRKKLLLEIARKSLVSSVLKTNVSYPDVSDSVLNEKCGAFVTLSISGNLRGCIGNIRASAPLWETVRKMAREAALSDPRFYPVSKNEIDDIEIEISVLSPFILINDTSQIEVGRHGLFIKKGFHQGLLLPQVAADYNWDTVEFLGQTCRKAGLPELCWKEKNCEIYIFSATVFSEEQFGR